MSDAITTSQAEKIDDEQYPAFLEAIRARFGEVTAGGSAGALERRFARLEDIQALWKPKAAEAPQERGGGARDVNHERSGGFFPEDLRSEYHGISATMEAYAKNATIAGAKEASACGIKLQKSAGKWDHLFRVTTKNGRVTYKLDRWD